jgi:NarL family two-component system response regulator LiaR
MQVLLIDDHPMTNLGLASCLEETGRFTVCAEANTLADACRFIEESEKFPSLIILDILLGEENGLDFLSFLDQHCRVKGVPKPPVVVCSVLEDPFRIQSAMKLGASAYVPKSSNQTELLKAIDAVLAGGTFIPERLVKLNESGREYAPFTKRENQVLALVKMGKTNAQIAAALSFSVRTAESHISNIYFKTGKTNRLELLNL